MKNYDLLNEFKRDHPKLYALSSCIELEQIKSIYSSLSNEVLVYDPPLLEIVIKHPFIFDNRLVPEEYHGTKVKNLMIGKYPKEFDEVEDNMRLEEYHNPKRYIRFVERRLSSIRKKLNRPTMSAEEALDALTNGFQEHVEWCLTLTCHRQ